VQREVDGVSGNEGDIVLDSFCGCGRKRGKRARWAADVVAELTAAKTQPRVDAVRALG